jgi:hypothetical protein
MPLLWTCRQPSVGRLHVGKGGGNVPEGGVLVGAPGRQPATREAVRAGSLVERLIQQRQRTSRVAALAAPRADENR